MDAINESFGANAGFLASVGVKFKDFNALTAALTVTGQTASEAQNGITAAMVGLEKPTGEMIGLYEKLGVVTGRDLLNKFGNIGDAIIAVSDAAKKANIEIPKLFNRNALKTVAHIDGGAYELYKKNYKEQMEGGDSLTSAYQKQLHTTAAQAQLAANNIRTLGIRIGELLLPALTKVVQVITPVIEALSNFAQKHKLITGTIVGSIAALGALSISVAAFSFLVYGVTKATWLWNASMVAVTAVTETMSTVLFLASADIVGFGMSIAAVLPEVTAVALAIGLLGAAYLHNANRADKFNAVMNDTNDKLTLQKGLLSQNEIGLQKYKAAYDDYQKYQQDIAIAKYDKEHNIKNLSNLFGLYQPNQNAPEAQMPNAEAFLPKGSFTETKDDKGNNVINLNVQVDKHGAVSVSGNGSNGSIPVKRGQTSSFNDD
jgi:hypothetical protein